MTTTSSQSSRCTECGAPSVSAVAPCARCGALPAPALHSPTPSDPAAADSLAALRRRTLWVLGVGALVRGVSMAGAPPWWPLDLAGLVAVGLLALWVRGLGGEATWDAVSGVRRALGGAFGALVVLTAAGAALVWRFGATGGVGLALSALHLGVALGGLGVALGGRGAR